MVGVDTSTVIWVLDVAVIVYTLQGGTEAVIWLDVIQGFMPIGGGLPTIAVIFLKTLGRPAAIFSTAAEYHKIGFGPYDLDFRRLTFVVMALNGIFYATQKYGTDQTIVQRYLVANSDREPIRASLVGVFMCVPVWTLFMFIGTCLFAFYTVTQVPLPEGIRPDAVFPHFIVSQLPVGVTGLILAALVAAALSSLDSDLNCLSAIGLKDCFDRVQPNASLRTRFLVGKLIVAISGLGAILVATFYVKAGNRGVLGTIFTLHSIFSGGIAGLFLLGLVAPRANKKGVYIGMAACVLFTAWAVLTSTPIGVGPEKRLLLDLGPYNYTHHKYMLGVYSHIVLFVVGFVASLFFKAPPPPKNLTMYGFKEMIRRRKAAHQ